MPLDVPVRRAGSGESKALLGRARLAENLEGQAEVVMIGRQTVRIDNRVARKRLQYGSFGQIQEVGRVQSRHVVMFAACLEAFESEFAYRLQHRVARLSIRPRLLTQQAFVD